MSRWKSRGFTTATIVASLALWAVGFLAQIAPASPFSMGADISLETFMQQQNVRFVDNGVEAPLDKILYDNGANLFRLRIFVNPQTTYTNTNAGAIQTQAYDIALAQQIKAHAPNARLLLDFHYSDTWADPGKQTKPAAWASLNLSSLQAQVQSYTQNTLQGFKDAGVLPDMVQVGNEISTGMLWGTTSNPAGGKIAFSGSTATQQTSWRNLGLLLNSAIQGVRAVQGTGPKIDVAIHIDQGDQDGHPQYYFGNLTNPTWGNVSDFDIVGISYYPSTSAFHGLNYLQDNLNEVADTYLNKKIMVLETNYPWETSSRSVPQWAATPAGQQQFLADLQNVMTNLHHDAGSGIVWWYPEAVPVPGYTIYNGGATALFDDNPGDPLRRHTALPALDAFGISLVPGDYNHDGTVNASDYTIWRNTLGSNSDLRANGDNTGASLGVVDLADYLFWKSHFGQTTAGGSLLEIEVPEPGTAWLVAVGIAAIGVTRLTRKRYED